MINVRLLKDMSNMKQFNAGSVIVRDGDAGEEMYILLKGQVGVYKNHLEPNEILLTTLMPGSFFGEMTLFLKKSRTATVVALENVVVLAINRMNTYKFFGSEHEATLSLIQTLCERITASIEACEALKTPSSGAIYRDGFFSEVRKSYLFSMRRPDENYIQQFRAGTVILNEGARTDKIYVVLKGGAGVYRNYKKNGETRVAEIMPGNIFGGLNFTDGVCTETVVADSDISAISLSPANIARFFECEPQAHLIMQILCERIDLLNKSQDMLSYHKMTNVGHTGHILFPDKHKRYDLPIRTEREYLHSKTFSCPVCGNVFSSMLENTSKLHSTSIDEDFRMHYDGIEPIYHDIAVCPNCWYSALQEYFDKGMATEYLFSKRMQPYKTALTLSQGEMQDINDVFVRYYLAVLCAENCFSSDKDINLAKLWLRLSWIYRDCGDEAMETFSTENAHKAFLKAYSIADFSPKQAQPMYIIMGVLCNRVGDAANARHFLTQARYSKTGSDAHKELAQELLARYGLDIRKQ